MLHDVDGTLVVLQRPWSILQVAISAAGIVEGFGQVGLVALLPIVAHYGEDQAVRSVRDVSLVVGLHTKQVIVHPDTFRAATDAVGPRAQHSFHTVRTNVQQRVGLLQQADAVAVGTTGSQQDDNKKDDIASGVFHIVRLFFPFSKHKDTLVRNKML